MAQANTNVSTRFCWQGLQAATWFKNGERSRWHDKCLGCQFHDAVGDVHNGGHTVFTKQSLGLRLRRLPCWLRLTQQIPAGLRQHNWPGSTVR